MRNNLILLGMLSLMPMLLRGQITGRVLDESGSPVPFASVRVEDKPGGAVADEEGWFMVRASKADLLVVTAAGIRDTVYVLGQLAPATPTAMATLPTTPLILHVTRRPGILEQIVITPFGIPRMETDIAYATQGVSGDEINRTPTLNLGAALAGKVAGLQVSAENTLGGSVNVLLRGFRSLTGSNQALFVVDGIPLDNTNHSIGGYDLGNGAGDIDPENVAGVSVLKGGAASALYGSRGANGAIMITTRRGDKKPVIDVSTDLTLGSAAKSTLPAYQTLYGQGYGDYFFQGTNGLIVETPYDAATGPAYQPGLMVYNWDAFSPTDPNWHRPTPWAPAARHNPVNFFVTPVTARENISIRSGDFGIGFTRVDDKGLFPNSRQTKNALNVSLSHRVTERLTVGGGLNYVQTLGLGRNLYLYTGTSNIMTDLREWWPTNADLHSLKEDYFHTGMNVTWNWPTAAYEENTAAAVVVPAYHDNPYWSQYQNYEDDTRNRYYGKVFVDYRVTGWLNLKGDFCGDAYTQMTEQRSNIGSQALSFYDRYDQTYSETNMDVYLEAAKGQAKALHENLLVGGNLRRTDNQSIEARTNGGLVVPGLYALSNSTDALTPPAETDFKRSEGALFLRATLSYKSMATLETSLRRDRSSALPQAHSTYFYPSVSGNIILSRTPWYGKLWINYAVVGNDPDTYALYNTFTASAPFDGSPLYVASPINGNPGLRPEFNKTWETGLEGRFLRDKVGVTLTVYRSVQTGQIMPAPVSVASGFMAFYVNGGNIRNQGLEVTLRVTPIRGRRLSWTLLFNASAGVGKVLSLYEDQSSFVIGNYQNSIQLVAEKGKAYGILRGTDYVYGPGGQRMIDATGHYMIAANKESDIGNNNPRWISGISSALTYKGLSFSVLVDVRRGGELYSLDMDYGSSSGLYPRTAGRNDEGNLVRSPLSQGGGIVLKGVLADGKTPNTQRIDESDVSQGRYSFGSEWGEADKSFVYDASYIKLREVSLSYVWRKITFLLAGRNLWMIHKNEPYADPEQGQASGNASMGFQNGAYPMVRQLSLGLKLRVL